MQVTDADILYECYLKLAQKNAAKSKRVDREVDKVNASGIAANTSLMFMRLTSNDVVIPALELQKYVLAVKGMYVQYHLIKGRNPSCLSDTMDRNMDQLIRAVCRHEADMITMFRQQEPGGDRIDIRSVFEQKKNLNRLGNTLARTIVAEAVNNTANLSGYFPIFFISATGKKYHRANCPYCKGRQLLATTKQMVENQKLTPCKCITQLQEAEGIDRTCVTAFVDESIHKVKWDHEGKKGKAGSYSYIICWGDLQSEDQITKERTIAKGVDFCGEHEHVERITETAVGKVLLTLLYDFEFSGPVRIYTDNQTTTNHWEESALNSKLAKHFPVVKVCFIPREKNKTADRLGRTRMLLDMPMASYNEILQYKSRVNELKRKVERLEAEKKADICIPEVIVADKVSHEAAEKKQHFKDFLIKARTRLGELFKRPAFSLKEF